MTNRVLSFLFAVPVVFSAVHLSAAFLAAPVLAKEQAKDKALDTTLDQAKVPAQFPSREVLGKAKLPIQIFRPESPDIHSQIIALESLDKWAEARKLMDTAGDVDVEVRVAAALMSEGKTAKAYEILHDKVLSFVVGDPCCGRVAGRIYMMKATLKNIEIFRVRWGP
jgi:hypothetical protein